MRAWARSRRGNEAALHQQLVEASFHGLIFMARFAWANSVWRARFPDYAPRAAPYCDATAMTIKYSTAFHCSAIHCCGLRTAAYDRERQAGNGRAMNNAKPLVTLAVDIGGTGLKMLCLDHEGKAAHRAAARSHAGAGDAGAAAGGAGQAAGTDAGVRSGQRWVSGRDQARRGAVGGEPASAVDWVPLQSALEKRWKKPVRVANDAAVQGYGAIQGRGVEMIITLGTGMGSALFTDGRLVSGAGAGTSSVAKEDV